ncbi:putative methyltransferase-domain-containing protein [Polychytrium aggregatum]|uniref:putative methyltransferase-domain-containing protein n=1 Tax=Polychytrium aggregatum TaxID=110093 RepID=UPI0022FEC009|nr:putative methyltransferase-domain-containing protein [Polychytrium aggregatum]KAI9202360.1 putative methyltransferase-domain-containing protein [Polychytrium aggregatum]
MGSKRKLPITVSKQRVRSNPEATQALIATYHTLNKQLTQHLSQNNHEAAKEAKRKMDELGGLDAYQRASLKGGDERKGRGASGRWITDQLRAEHQRIEATLPTQNPKIKLKLLDVGATSGETYKRLFAWVDVTAIDLNPQCLLVKRQDYFERPFPETDDEKFHVVCMSLVINFVGDVAKRGEMLVRTLPFLYPEGLFYIVIPLPCVTNSRYMTHDHFVGLMGQIGFDLIEFHHATKVAYYLFRKSADSDSVDPSGVALKKVEINPGPGRNNFAIVIQPQPQPAAPKSVDSSRSKPRDRGRHSAAPLPNHKSPKTPPASISKSSGKPKTSKTTASRPAVPPGQASKTKSKRASPKPLQDQRLVKSGRIAKPASRR